MVDAAAPLHRIDRAAQVPAAAVLRADAEALAEYEAFCGGALYAPAQSAAWVGNWTAETRPDAVIAILSAAGRPVFSLALEVVRSGPFRIARFMGGHHANGNFAATDRGWLATERPLAVRDLVAAIASARPDIDLIWLERLVPELDGKKNPLACLPHYPSPNISLAVDLEGGFDRLLDRVSGKRKRKKHRSQMRKFEAVGPHRRIEAKTPEEAHALLEAFFAMKAQRFRKMGIADVFGKPEIRAFFRALFAGALGDTSPRFVLHGLEVAGKLRAVTGSSVCGRRLICEFGAIADDDLAHASPGDFLFFDNIEDACEKGFEIYDFSVGDEPYKRLWSDLEVRHFDVVSPLTPKGRALALWLRQGARLKGAVKNNPALWKLARRLRRKAAGKALPSPDGES